MDQRDQIEAKVNNEIAVSVIAYLTLVGWFVAILFLNKPKTPLADFHIRQAIGINLFFIGSGIVFIVPFLGWIAGAIGYILAVIMWIIGIIYAFKGIEKEVPFFGKKFQEWFQAL